jgi:hypothetical protein
LNSNTFNGFHRVSIPTLILRNTTVIDIDLDEKKGSALGIQPSDKVLTFLRPGWPGNDESFQMRKSMDVEQIGFPMTLQLQKSQVGKIVDNGRKGKYYVRSIKRKNMEVAQSWRDRGDEIWMRIVKGWEPS